MGAASRHSDTACDALFSGFHFDPIRDANPPEAKGVYVIRIRAPGEPIALSVSSIKSWLGRIDWPIVEKHVGSRLNRLSRIGTCRVIYIGSAGTNEGSRNTLKGRYAELAHRHTAMYPLWLLLYYRWDLEYGYLKSEKPKETEEKLKDQYRALHDDNLPGLVET